MLFVEKWIELKTIVLNEVSQIQKGKYLIFSFVREN